MPRSQIDASGESERLRVLLVTPLPPPVGGIGTWAETLLQSSLPQQLDVAVLDTSPASSESLRGGNRLRLGRVGGSLGALVRALAETRSFRPHLVHVNSSYYWGFLRDGAIVWITSLLGARVLLHLHGGDFDVFLRRCPALLLPLVRATLRRCDAVLVLTAAMRRELSRIASPERVRVLPNFVNAELFGGAGEREEHDFVEVLFVGWVIEAKGVRELLRAARALPEARFHLVGPIDAAFRASIAGELSALGDRVRLLGQLPHEEMQKRYADFDVFVLPTHREGFPLSVLEAMAAGLPVVATPVGAIPDAVREGQDGFLVPVKQPAMLEGRLRRLVQDPKLRREMGEAARRRVEEHYDVETVVAQLVELYRGVAPETGA